MNECARKITWAGGEHVFNLNDKRILLMMDVRGPSSMAALRRFEEQSYTHEDVERVIELGLMGGGMSRSEASALVEEHVRLKPIGPNAVVAFEVLAALFTGSATLKGAA